jgi:hypothetical protein
MPSGENERLYVMSERAVVVVVTIYDETFAKLLQVAEQYVHGVEYVLRNIA